VEGIVISGMVSFEQANQLAVTLKKSRFAFLAVAMLEDGGVIRPLLSQGMLAFSPLLGVAASSPWVVFAEILDDRNASYALAAQIKREPNES